MSTSPKVKLIIPIENGDARSTLEHMKRCQIEFNELIKNGRMSEEVILKPKTNFLSEENYLIYKDFIEQLQAKGNNFIPVFLIESNVDVSVGLLSENCGAVVIDQKKGSVSLFSEHAQSKIGEDLRTSKIFSDIQRGKPMGGESIRVKSDTNLLVDVMASAMYLKLSESLGAYDLQYVHDRASLTRIGKIYNLDQKRAERDKEEIQLA